jgi:bacillopeptidase F (M6 metalloprotease family)
VGANTPGPSHRVSGTVTNSATGMPVAGATMRILDTPIAPATSDANGMYAFPVIPDGAIASR